MSPLRTVGLVAGFDLYESLRSRKAVALILIYVVVAVGGTAMFASALNRVFAQLNTQLGNVPLETLLESKEMLKFVTKVTGDDEALAKELLRVPPLALFYGWLLRGFMPLIAVLSSANAVASEISSGSARFSLFRVSRGSWVFGKLLGQAALMVVGILVGALACFLMGWIMLDRFAPGDTLIWLLRMALRGSFYAFAYLGIAMCASLLVRSNAAAIGLGLLFAFLAAILGGIFHRLAEPMQHLEKLFPNGHDVVMFRPELAGRLTAFAALLAIGLAWFGLGFLRFSRRDA